MFVFVKLKQFLKLFHSFVIKTSIIILKVDFQAVDVDKQDALQEQDDEDEEMSDQCPLYISAIICLLHLLCSIFVFLNLFLALRCEPILLGYSRLRRRS